MGRLLEPMDAFEYRPLPELTKRHRRLLDAAMAIFEPEGAAQVPVEARIAAAEALGQGGDPRLARPLANLIEVPGLTGWSLGKYPVTVEEYRAFIEDGGYAQPRWWDAVGWQQRNKEGWDVPGSWDQQLVTPNRPVVEVSWFEAGAFCAWLGAQWQRPVQLPDEAQWQRTAQGEDGRKYPWGGEARSRTRSWRTSPKTSRSRMSAGRPRWASILPAMAPMAIVTWGGNVWEWCADVLPEENLPKEWEGTPGGAPVLRGGGWDGPAVFLRAAYRLRDPAGYRNVDVGFRVAVAPASLGS
jgi:formylglycine-generating enzyme required for sulfatase activity